MYDGRMIRIMKEILDCDCCVSLIAFYARNITSQLTLI